MTFKQLKESVEDRIRLFENTKPIAMPIERLEEARVILDLINLVDDPNASTDSLAAVRTRHDHEADGELDRYDPGRC